MRLGWFSIGCLLLGHDDLIRRKPHQIYLECCECGRTTPGWTIGQGRRGTSPSAVKDVNPRVREFAEAA